MTKRYCSTPLVTFEKNVIKKDGCWEWAGCKSSGYAVISRNGCSGKNVRFYAHRLSYQIYKGKIPDGMDVMHLCHNSSCTNPNHLGIGSRRENMAGSRKAGRLQRKIPLNAVPSIIARHKSGETFTSISKEYNCSAVAIRHMVRAYV